MKPIRCFDVFNVDLDKDLIRTAFHEAGHAVVGWKHRIGLEHVLIARRHGEAVRQEIASETIARLGDTKGREVVLEVVLAGGCAQQIYQPCSNLFGCDEDERTAASVLTTLSEKAPSFLSADCIRGPREFLAIIRYRADLTLRGNWGRVEALAAALLEANEIDGERATRIIEAAPALSRYI